MSSAGGIVRGGGGGGGGGTTATTEATPAASGVPAASSSSAVTAANGPAPPSSFDAVSSFCVALRALASVQDTFMILNVETVTGYVYRGILDSIDEHMNVKLRDVSAVTRHVWKFPPLHATTANNNNNNTPSSSSSTTAATDAALVPERKLVSSVPPARCPSSVLLRGSDIVLMELPASLTGTHRAVAQSVVRAQKAAIKQNKMERLRRIIQQSTAAVAAASGGGTNATGASPGGKVEGGVVAGQKRPRSEGVPTSTNTGSSGGAGGNLMERAVQRAALAARNAQQKLRKMEKYDRKKDRKRQAKSGSAATENPK